MHPGMMYWWKRAHERAHCGDAWAGAGFGFQGDAWHDRRQASGDRFGDLGAGLFGVRRPLRFLAYKLDLSDKQVEELARILGELKTERAQAEVDARRVLAAFADALDGESFDGTRAADAGTQRLASAEHLRDAVLKTLQRMHAVLDAEQRSRLAYLIRTGTLVL